MRCGLLHDASPIASNSANSASILRRFADMRTWRGFVWLSYMPHCQIGLPLSSWRLFQIPPQLHRLFVIGFVPFRLSVIWTVA